jgi:hypothetical protein
MKGKVASKVVDYAVEAEKQKLKKKAKKRVKSVIFRIFGTVVVFCIGVFAGIHWRVILALIKKGEIPEAPKDHCHKFR